MNLPAAPSQVVSPTSLLTGEEARAYATDLAKSSMLSTFFQGSVENVMFAMELGKIYNLEPAALLQNIHVFETFKDGVKSLKASLSANLMVYLARNAGHIVTTKSNPNKASCTIIRGDTIFAKMLLGNISPEELAHYSNILSVLKEMDMDPKQYAVTEAVWSMEKAHTAGLVKEKGNWVKYPHAMLAARAKADAIRMACEEVLIKLNNTASAIGGGFSTADGLDIPVDWTHTADELGASITDDGELIELERGRSAQAAPRATQPQAQKPAPAPARDDSLDKAAVQAQAQTDPSKAGWGKPSAPEPEPKKDSQAAQAAQVRSFVEAKPFAETLALLERTATADGLTDDARDARLGMLLNPVAELCTTEQIMQALGAVQDHTDKALLAIADYAQAAKVAEIVQEISLLEDIEPGDRLKQIYVIYNQLKASERLDDPAPFFDKASDQARETSLGKVVKILVQPLIKIA